MDNEFLMFHDVEKEGKHYKVYASYNVSTKQMSYRLEEIVGEQP